jgi:signal transduction histidine kinase
MAQKKFSKNPEINGTKDEFLSFATHQLRSPLTSLKWGLEALSHQVEANSEEKILVAKLRETADDMISTVNDLLDISKIQQGRLMLNTEPTDLVELLDRAAEEFRTQAQLKNLKLLFTTDLSGGLIVADKTKLRQVINNLLDNAVKYTDTGSVTVNLSKNSPKNLYVITVSDTGKGITPDEIDSLFQKFIRGSAGKSSFGGSGLGLYLSKKIIEMHRGTIHIVSDGIGKGSMFIVSLPDNSETIAQ